MKPNVDLTENMDFRTRLDGLSKGLQKVIGIKYPWDETLKLSRVRFDTLELIVTGDKERRRSYKFERDVDSSCQRCGKRLYRRPWIREYDLCRECYEWLEDECDSDRDFFLSELKKRRMRFVKQPRLGG